MWLRQLALSQTLASILEMECSVLHSQIMSADELMELGNGSFHSQASDEATATADNWFSNILVTF